MGRAVNRVIHAALSQAVDDGANDPRARHFAAAVIRCINARCRGLDIEDRVNGKTLDLLGFGVLGVPAVAQVAIAELFVLYEERRIGGVPQLIPLNNADTAGYFPNFRQRYNELFGCEPPSLSELGRYNPMVETPAENDMSGVIRRMEYLGLTPRLLEAALFQLTPEDIDHEATTFTTARDTSESIRRSIFNYNVALPRQRRSSLPANLANIQWDSTTVDSNLMPGALYDKVVDYVRNAGRLHSHYGPPTMTPQAWLCRQPYFCALIAETGRRGQTLPRDVMSFIRSHLLKRGQSPTTVVPAATPETTYADPALRSEQAADLAAMANVKPVYQPPNRNARSVRL